jgi:hypothetical protein
MKLREATILAVALCGALLTSPPAEAGCGCDKPPPAPAEIRPRTTYPGALATLFAPGLQAGKSYEIEFAAGTTDQTLLVRAVAVRRRDLADGVDKVQLPVPVPAVPLGPTGITVWDGAAQILAVSDADFTVTAAPVVIPAEPSQSVLSDYRTGVGRDGVVYISLDLSQVTEPLVIRARLRGYPLRFAGDDAVFYNTQGFLMQALDAGIPGLFTLAAPSDPGDSDVLQYSRHEFNTFFLQHAERQEHSVSADDPNWHLDGTPHIDHDHLILGLSATLADGTVPAPGQTPPADLVIETFSLFAGGITAVGDVTMSNAAYTTSYDSRTLEAGHSGDVLSGGVLTMTNGARIDGTAVVAAVEMDSSSDITGDTLLSTAAVSTMPVQIPSGLIDLGSRLALSKGQSFELVGPGSYLASAVGLARNSRLSVNNASGPVTLYVTGGVSVAKDASVAIADPNPEKFAVYVLGQGPIQIARSAAFAGVIYAPQASLELSQGGVFYGSFVARSVEVSGSSGIAYDVALRGGNGALWPPLTDGAPEDATADPTAPYTPSPTPTPTAVVSNKWMNNASLKAR